MVVVQEIQFESIFPETIESWRRRELRTFGMQLLQEKGREKNKNSGDGDGELSRMEAHGQLPSSRHLVI